jgi:hypothetical protein
VHGTITIIIIISQFVTILRDVRESLANQQTSGEPLVRDVLFPRLKRNKVYSVYDSFSLQFSSSTSVEIDFSVSPRLQDFLNNSSFSLCFDAYRIMALRLQFTCLTQLPSTSGNSVFTVIDYDDNTIAAITALLQYDTLKQAPLGAYFERVFIPRSTSPVGTTTALSQTAVGTWLDVADNSTRYFGLKGAFGSTSNVVTYQVVITALIQFKNTR